MDLFGQTFGRLYVVRKAGKTKDGKEFLWLCKCECLNEVEVNQRSLLDGKTQSCGCLRREILRTSEKDFVGKKFGALTVIEFSGISSNRRTEWLCSCDCGNRVVVEQSQLVCGNKKTCGCRCTRYSNKLIN